MQELPGEAPTAASSGSGLTVICLCAAWCNACGEFQPVFEALRQTLATDRLVWVDIEEQPEVLGELDIANFPTMVIATAAGAVRFGGAVQPHAAVVTRLIDAARSDSLLGGVDAELQAQYRHAAMAADLGAEDLKHNP